MEGKSTQRSIRLDPETRRLLALLSERLGINQTAVIKQAIRLLAKREKIK